MNDVDISGGDCLKNNYTYSVDYLCVSSPLIQTGPCDVSQIDPEFTLQPVPASVNDRCQRSAASEAFPGFSFMNPVEYMATQLVS